MSTKQSQIEFLKHIRNQNVIAKDDVLEQLPGGRSNTVWRVSGANRSVLKLFALQSTNPLFANDQKNEVAVLKSLSGSQLAPEVRLTGSFGRNEWLQYEYVPGKSWRNGTRAVAQVLGRVHKMPAPASLPFAANGSAEIEEQIAAIIGTLSADKAKKLCSMMIPGRVKPNENVALIHGDPVPGNIMEENGMLTLIDWQCPAKGDPAEDLAIFLSPAMQLLYRGYPLSDTEVDEFLDAYPDPLVAKRYLALKPWYALRMAAYCAWQEERGEFEYSSAFELEWAVLKQLVH